MTGRLAVGVDVGGTHAKLALVGEDGTVHAHDRLDSGSSATSGTLRGTLTGAIETILAAAGDRDAVAGIGLAVPGFVDVARRLSVFSPNTPGLVGGELPDAVAAATGLPVAFDSDVNTATLGEYAWGVGRGASRFLCLTLGTGVGGGLIVDGELVRFTGATIGDIGHVILEPGGRRCSAGCAGCAEALIGAAGLVEWARASGAPLAADRASAVIEAVRAGETWAARVAERIGGLLGLLLASLMPIFLPDRVAIAGGTMAMGEVLIEAARHTVEAIGGAPYVRERPIVAGHHGSLAGAIGAAALVFARRRGASGR